MATLAVAVALIPAAACSGDDDGSASTSDAGTTTGGTEAAAIRFDADAQRELAAFLAELDIRDAQVPVVSNVHARPVTAAAEIRQNLVDQMTSPVRWEESMRFLLDSGVTEFYEIGAGKVLRGLLRSIERSAKCTNVGPAESIPEALAQGGIA